MKKNKKNKWFIKIRRSYLPCSMYGWFSYIPYSVFLIGSLFIYYSLIANKIIAVAIIAINWLMAFTIMTLIAMIKS